MGGTNLSPSRKEIIMATEKQIAANRLNALKSTGPRTAAGKARSSRNALRHGMCAAVFIGERSGPDLRQWVDAMRAELRPVTPLQRALFPRIVNLMWRLRRVHDIENRFLHIERDKLDPTGELNLTAAEVFARQFADESNGRAVLLLSRYESSLNNAMTRLLREFREEEARRAGTLIPQRTQSKPRDRDEIVDAEREMEQAIDRSLMRIAERTRFLSITNRRR